MPGASLFKILVNLNTAPTLFTELSTSTHYPGPKLPALLDHIFAGYIFLCPIDAHGKTSLLVFHQVPLDPGKIELLQTFCKYHSFIYPMIPDPSKQDQHSPSIDKCEVHVLTGHKVPQHKVIEF